MRRKTYAQLVALLGLALGVVQLSGVTVPDAKGSSALSDARTLRRPAFAPQSASRVTGNASVQIDGRTHPEQVPDELAFRLYLKSMTVRGTPSAHQVLRQTAFLKQLKLPAADERLFVEALRDISPELTRVEQERRQLTKEEPSGLSKQVSLKVREDQALDQALTKLTGRLSPEGWDRLNAHVRSHVKSSIVVFEVNHGAH